MFSSPRHWWLNLDASNRFGVFVPRNMSGNVLRSNWIEPRPIHTFNIRERATYTHTHISMHAHDTMTLDTPHWSVHYSKARKPKQNSICWIIFSGPKHRIGAYDECWKAIASRQRNNALKIIDCLIVKYDLRCRYCAAIVCVVIQFMCAPISMFSNNWDIHIERNGFLCLAQTERSNLPFANRSLRFRSIRIFSGSFRLESFVWRLCSLPNWIIKWRKMIAKTINRMMYWRWGRHLQATPGHPLATSRPISTQMTFSRWHFPSYQMSSTCSVLRRPQQILGWRLFARQSHL